jgi:biopolymer transport protein ExbB
MYSDINWLESIGSSPIFIVLIGLSVITLAAAIERIHYFRKRNGQADETLDHATREIRRGDRKEAKRICKSCNHPFGPVAGSIMENEGLESEKAEEQLQVSMSQQQLLLENNLGILGTMAAVAPLIGLLGTVWGIMRAFRDMSSTGSAAPSVVAAGIAEALTTTAAGLIIAVPALMLYNHLARRISVMLTVAENNSRTLRLELERSPVATAPDKRSNRSDRENAASDDRRKAEEIMIEDVAEELETVMAE